MPFVSEAQRRKFHAMANRGEISADTLREWVNATPKDLKLPEHVRHPKKPKRVKRAYAEGVADALAQFGFKTASQEVRLQIPKRKFHGFDAAFQAEAERGCKRAEDAVLDDSAPVERFVDALQALDAPQDTQPTTARKDPLDRSALWSSPSHLDAGDAGNRQSDLGQPTDIGAVF